MVPFLFSQVKVYKTIIHTYDRECCSDPQLVLPVFISFCIKALFYLFSLFCVCDVTVRGGVYSPGAAFYKTSLIDRLHTHSIKFSVRSPQ